MSDAKSDIDHQDDDPVGNLKHKLFNAGHTAVERVLGYEIDPEEDKDVTDHRLDAVLDEMSDERVRRLLVVATVDELMLGTEDNLRCDPDDRYDQGYHDALLDVLAALGESRPEYGEHFN